MGNSVSRSTVVIAVWLLCCAAAQGEIIHFQMSGQITVDYLEGNLPAGIYEGAPFQVDLSFDTTTPDSYSDDPQRGFYQTVVGPDNYLVFRAGPSEIRAHDVRLWVGNDIDGNPEPGNDDRPIWDLPDDDFQMLTSQLIANFPLPPFHSIGFAWIDPTRAAFTTDLLPTSLDLDQFQNTWFKITTIALNPGDDFYTFRGMIDRVEVVPEPSAFCIATILATIHFLLRLVLRARRVFEG